MTFDIGIICASFLIVFLAELGDKTQLVAFSFTTNARHPLVIFIATSFALSLSSVIAAILGGVASQVIPQVASWIAIALFFLFGFYILFSKEAPAVKECFLKTIALETSLLRIVPKIFKKAGMFNHQIAEILRQDSSHAAIFRTLLKGKKLFKDDINQDEQMKCLQEELGIARKLASLPFEQALEVIVEKETAVRNMYQYFHDHLSLEHHKNDNLQETLAALVREENEHIRLFKRIKNKEVL